MRPPPSCGASWVAPRGPGSSTRPAPAQHDSSARARSRSQWFSPSTTFSVLLEFGDIWMMQKMLLNLRERHRPHTWCHVPGGVGGETQIAWTRWFQHTPEEGGGEGVGSVELRPAMDPRRAALGSWAHPLPRSAKGFGWAEVDLLSSTRWAGEACCGCSLRRWCLPRRGDGRGEPLPGGGWSPSAAAAVSQVAIATSWSDAKAGTVVNVVLVLAAGYGLFRSGRPAFTPSGRDQAARALADVEHPLLRW